VESTAQSVRDCTGHSDAGVTDQELGRFCALVEVQEEVAGLLGGSRPVGVGGGSEDVHVPGLDPARIIPNLPLHGCRRRSQPRAEFWHPTGSSCRSTPGTTTISTSPPPQRRPKDSCLSSPRQGVANTSYPRNLCHGPGHYHTVEWHHSPTPQLFRSHARPEMA